MNVMGNIYNKRIRTLYKLCPAEIVNIFYDESRNNFNYEKISHMMNSFYDISTTEIGSLKYRECYAKYRWIKRMEFIRYNREKILFYML